TLAAFALLALAGVGLGWSQGQLPQREPPAAASNTEEQIASDLALYRDVIAEVRGGADYYAVAGQRIPQYGFPIASPLNWRLPTYAWVLSRLPAASIQPVLVALSIIALTMAFAAPVPAAGIGTGSLTTFLLFGVVHLALHSQA